MTPILAALLLIGQAPTRVGEVAFRPGPDEADVPAIFRMADDRFAFEVAEVRRERSFTVSTVRFPSPLTTPDPENNTVHAEFFRPNGASKAPGVVILHILGADFALSRFMAARLADRGVAALFVKLPYYGERRPAGDAKKFLSVDAERSLRSMRQGVLDIRRATTWLADQPGVDPTRLGVGGISLGGIMASLAAEADPRLKSAAFLLAGGDLGEILWSMPETARHRVAWAATGRTKADLVALTRPIDPLTYADRLRGKRLMMIAGNVDEVIPPASARALWSAAGEPPITWLDCGHYSFAALFLPAVQQAVEFFAEGVPR